MAIESILCLPNDGPWTTSTGCSLEMLPQDTGIKTLDIVCTNRGRDARAKSKQILKKKTGPCVDFPEW
jgi:hypothetical protein